MTASAQQWLDKIHALDLPPKVKVMNVCGGHERAITQSGMRTALPDNIELIPGPGCPVCICPEEDIYHAIQLALYEDVILLAFGDMLRVPVNVPKPQARSLEQAKSQGADVRPIASPADAARIAKDNPERAVVFFVAGFETTIAPVAASVSQGLPDNLFLLLSGRLTWPAVAMLLDSGEAAFDALIAPGHVATVMGPEEWTFVTDDYRIPAAIAGFTPQSILAALYSTLRQFIEHRIFLDNCYAEVVKPGGNSTAKHLLQKVTDIVDANWRGIGVIPASGFSLKQAYAAHDARLLFPAYDQVARKRMGEMPPGCECAQVVLGKVYPSECGLYAAACTPRTPIGPCMVSDEGACRIWWAGGVREPAEHAVELSL
jgi:hydrogenase expression/formation protein HypD